MICDNCIHKSKTRKSAIEHFPDERYCEFWKVWHMDMQMCSAKRLNRQLDMVDMPFYEISIVEIPPNRECYIDVKDLTDIAFDVKKDKDLNTPKSI